MNERTNTPLADAARRSREAAGVYVPPTLLDVEPCATPPAVPPVTASARITPELRSKLEALAVAEGHGQISQTIRAALIDYVDRAARQDAALQGGVGTARRVANAAEHRAKMKVAPRVGSQRHAALRAFVNRGPLGANASEVIALLEGAGMRVATNGAARRVTDLLEGEMVLPKRTADTALGDRVETDGTVTRPTSNGGRGTVYVATPSGHRALQTADAVAAAKAAKR